MTSALRGRMRGPRARLASEWMPYLPAATTPVPARRCRARVADLGRDRRPGRLHAPAGGAGHTHPLRRPHGRRLRAPAAVQRGRARRTSQRRRHPEDPVAGLPRRGPPAALRRRARARDDRRRHVRSPRRVLRHEQRRVERAAVRGRARPRARRRPVMDCFVLGGAKHGLASRDLPPSVSLFQGVRVADDGALRLDGLRRCGHRASRSWRSCP